MMNRHPALNPEPERYTYVSADAPDPPFETPSTRRRNYITDSQDAEIDDHTNTLIGHCVEWRKQYTTYKHRKFSKSNLQRLEDERENLIVQVNSQATTLSRRRGAEFATELVDMIKPNLILPGYQPSVEARCMGRFWTKVSGTVQQQVQQLKLIRYELTLAMIMEKYIHIDDLDMLESHAAVFHRSDMLRYCTLAMEHKERVRDRSGYRITLLAERDTDQFVDELDQRWRDRGNMKSLSAREETNLMTAFRSQVRRRFESMTAQDELADQGRYQAASMLLMTKAAIVVQAGLTLGLHGAVEVARAKISDFVARQNFVTASEIRQAGQQQLEHITSQYPDRSIWPDI